MKMATGRITIDPVTCGGRPFFSGTRVPVYVVLEMLANRENPAEILSVKDALTFARNVVLKQSMSANSTSRVLQTRSCEVISRARRYWAEFFYGELERTTC